MAITTGVLSFVTIIPVWAIYFCAGTNVPCYVRLDVLTIRDVQYAPPAEGEGGPEGPEGAGGAGGPEGAEGAGGPEGAEGAGGPEGPEGAGGDIEDRANMVSKKSACNRYHINRESNIIVVHYLTYKHNISKQ